MEKQKILIVTCKKFGAGHYSVAKALEEYLEQREDVEVFLYDWTFMMGKWYELTLSKTPFMWKYFYKFFESKLSIEFSRGYEKNLMQKKASKPLEYFDKIILTVHSAHYMGYSNKLADRTYVVVTDYGVAAKAWGLYHANTFFVCDEVTEKYLRTQPHLKDTRIINSSIPVNTKVKELATVSKKDIRKELEIVSKSFYVIAGGGAGDKSLVKVFNKLLEQNLTDKSFLVVCGRNKKLHTEFNEILEEKGINNIKIVEFVKNDDLLKYYRAADMVLTKPGGITLTELIGLNTPIAVAFAQPHEYGNRNFVTKNKIGIVSENLDKLFSKIFSLTEEELNKYSQNERKVAKYDSAKVICEEVLKNSKSQIPNSR